MVAQPSSNNPLVEQRELASGSAICLLSNQGVLQVLGDDRLSWLHSLLSQNLQSLEPGDSTEALLLDPNGRIEQIIRVIDDGHSTWLIVDGERGADLFSWLNKMVFRLKVEVIDQSNEFTVVGSTIEKKHLASKSNEVELIWIDPWPNQSSGGFRYSHREVNFDWRIHLVKNTELEERIKEERLVNEAAYEALRIAAGRPSARFELDEKTLPHELDLLSTAVHLSKGCYRGQETVAKVHNLGHPPRRLTFLHLDGSNVVLPTPGSSIREVGDDKAKGLITSSAQHYEMGPIALALINRLVPESAPLEVLSEDGIVRASQEVIVPASAGKVADVPKIPRLNLSANSKSPRS